MTEQQFNEACRYANADLDPNDVDKALEIMDEWRCPLYMASESINRQIAERMDEWCEDHEISTDAWREWGDEEDAFFNA